MKLLKPGWVAQVKAIVETHVGKVPSELTNVLSSVFCMRDPSEIISVAMDAEDESVKDQDEKSSPDEAEETKTTASLAAKVSNTLQLVKCVLEASKNQEHKAQKGLCCLFKASSIQ